MSAAVRSLVHLPAAIGGWSRQWIFARRVEVSLVMLLGLTLGVGLASHVAVARLGQEVERLNRTGVSSLQLSNEIVRRTLATGLRTYQDLARAEISAGAGQSLTEVEMLVDSLSRILQQNFGSDSWRLVWLQEIRAAKDAYVAALAELTRAASDTGEIDPYLFYTLSSKGDVLISKAEAFQRVLNEEIALRAREIERQAGLARTGVAAGTGAALAVGALFAFVLVRGVRERASGVQKEAADLGERLRALSEKGELLVQSHLELEEQVAQIERALLIGSVYKEFARGGLERSIAAVEASRSSHEQCLHPLAQLQERVDRLALAIRGLVGIVDQISMLALRARFEAERCGSQGSKLAAIAGEIEHLADRGVTTGDQIREDLARVKDAADTSAASLAKTLSSVFEAAHQAESLAASMGALEQSNERVGEYVAGLREKVRAGAPARDTLLEAIESVAELARRIRAQAHGRV